MQHSKATGILQGSIDHNRELLLFSLMGLYAIMLMIHGFYHGKFTFNDAFGHVAVGFLVAFILAAAVQVIRFVLVITGTKEIGRGGFLGFVGMLFSLGITCYLAYELPHVAEWWSQGDPKKFTAMHIVTQMLNWFGWVLEIMLVASVGRDLKEHRATVARASSSRSSSGKARGGQGRNQEEHEEFDQEEEPFDFELNGRRA